MDKIERLLIQQGKTVYGIDEVGRGCLAGPVVAAAAVLNYERLRKLPPKAKRLITDSKALTHEKRQAALGHLEGVIVAQAIGIASVTEIDTVGILNASFLAMRRALAQIKDLMATEPHILVDGHMKIRECALPQTPVIEGDAKCASISAASIIAKEYRDQMMRDFDEVFPGYGFAQNMGYGTKQHLAGLEMHGVCMLHRHSFAPVRRFAALTVGTALPPTTEETFVAQESFAEQF